LCRSVDVLRLLPFLAFCVVAFTFLCVDLVRRLMLSVCVAFVVRCRFVPLVVLLYVLLPVAAFC